MLCAVYMLAGRYLRLCFHAEPVGILVGLMISWFPLFVSIWQGQDTAFLFLGVTMWTTGILKARDTLTAVGLALTSMKPHICFALAMSTMFRWPVLWRFVSAVLGLGLYSVWLLGVDGLAGLRELLLITASADWFGLNPERMANVAGNICTCWGIGVDHSTMAYISWIAYAAGVVAIAFLWWRSSGPPARRLAATVLIAVVTAPHLNMHDLALLLVPLVLVLVDADFRLSDRGLLRVLVLSRSSS